MRPSECWACRVLFDDDLPLKLAVIERLRDVGPVDARELVDERLAEAHAEHPRVVRVLPPPSVS